MANGFTILTSRDNTFFTNNKMTIGSGIPTSGSYKVGDIVISDSQADGIFGWVCTREGAPGNWEVIGSGAGGGNSVLVEYSNVVEFRDARTSIDIGINEYNKETDSLEVHYNGLLLAEGVHYSINENGTAITNLNGSWNVNADDTQAMIFVVRKSTAGLNVVPMRNVVDINSATMEVDPGIKINPSSDIVSVHLNGVMLMKDVDYRIENGKLIKVDQTEAWNPYNVVGQKMYIEVLRNKGSLNEPDAGSIGKEHLNDELAREINNNTNSINSLTGIANDHTTLISNLTEQIGNVDFSEVEAKIGNLPSLQTNAKDSLVDAVNELFQSANNGKELIANAIGEPVSAEDTFNAMSNDINGLLSTFKTNMMNNGVSVAGTDKFKQLIDKLATLADNEGKGVQYASGEYVTATYEQGDVIISTNLGFEPQYFVVFIEGFTAGKKNSSINYVLMSNSYDLLSSDKLQHPVELRYYDGYDTRYTSVTVTLNYNSESFTLSGFTTEMYLKSGASIKWYAIGVGEEDTTLRDSLASILENKGVDVTEEDDMASLISKVDNMRVVDPNERLISNYYYPFEITRTYTTITNMDYTIRDNIIYYFVEGATGSSTSAREAYIYKYNMDTKTVVKSLKVDKNTTSTSESIFLEDNILIFSYTSVTLYSYDDLSQIKTTTFGGTLCAGAKFLKYENYIYGLVLNGLVFKFDIDAFKTVKSTTMSSDYQMNDPRVLIIDNGFIYAGSAYAGAGYGPYYKFDMDLTLKTNTGTITVFSGGSFIMNGYVYSVSAFFNGGTTPALHIYKIDMNTSGNTLEAVQNLVNLNSIFTPSSTQNLVWKYFIVNGDIFITYSNVIAKFSKNDINTLTTNTPTYFCIPSSGENIINITSSGDYYEITTIGQRGVSVFKSSDFF